MGNDVGVARRGMGPYGWGRTMVVWLLAGLVAGCVPQIHSTIKHRDISLKPGDLEAYGLAFITPSTVTGEEQDKQALALLFADVLRGMRPEVPCVTFPETLGRVNRAGLAKEYRRMYADYRDTGIFVKDSLQKVGEAAGARYLAQLKLAGFQQGAQDRLGLLGLRILDTKQSNLRLFFQIWNSHDGSIAWEGYQELSYAYDTALEKPVTFRTVVEIAARNLVEQVP